ncbi:hypothetical protein [Actinomadura sp. 3N407]|uniref:hypothetical protein n=1 Tax=Actinomadura sp. 3N407 TaxID=3457423 RepID=UPI003FCDBEC3
MAATWSLIITTAGAVATTLLGVIVGGLVSSRAQARHWTRDREMEACALLLRESSNILIELAAMNGRRVNPRAGEVRPVSGQSSEIDWRPWNEALAMVNLIANDQIVEAAHVLDAEIWPVHLKIKAEMLQGDDWFPLRDQIEQRRREFINVARRQLGATGRPLHRISGRPELNDPVWELRRPRRNSAE